MEILNRSKSLYNTFGEQFSVVLFRWLNEVRQNTEAIDKDITLFVNNFCKVEDKNVRSSLLRNLNENIFKRIDELNSNLKKYSFNDDFSKLFSELNKKLSELPEFVTIDQGFERFHKLEGDSILLTYLKFNKLILFKTSALPRGTGNLARKIFRKETLPPKTWKQNIAFLKLNEYYFRNHCSIESLRLVDSTLNVISKLYRKLYNIVKKLDESFLDLFDSKEISETEYLDKTQFEEIYNILNELELSIKEELTVNFDKYYEEFETNFYKANTIEFAYRKFDRKKIDLLNNELNSKYKELMSGWNYNLFLLFDDWRLYQEIYLYMIKNIEGYIHLQTVATSRLEGFKNEHIQYFKKSISDIKEKFELFTGINDELKSFLSSEKETLSRELSEKIEQNAIEALIKLNIPLLVDEFEGAFYSNLKGIADERAVIKSNDNDKKMSKSDISYISPKELLSFEALPGIIKTVREIKSKLIINFENIQQDIQSVDDIADYNIESAIASIDDNDVESKQIAVDGLGRAIAKIDDAQSKIDNIISFFSSDLKLELDKFNKELIELNDMEKLFQKKLSIAKAKAIQRTNELKRKTINYIKNFIPIAVDFSRNNYLIINERYHKYRKIFGIDKVKTHISAEISDFLTATHIAIEKLPFAYQRLFKISPLDDDRFYEPREYEISGIVHALNNWKKGFFAPVIVNAEKGSGLTTLINMFLNKSFPDENVIRIVLDKPIYTEKLFIDLWKQKLSDESINNIEDIITTINKNFNKSIIVVENIHFFFIKKVNGFDNIQKFLDVISLTSKNVFWLTSMIEYTWEYLNKTINISDNYGYVVKLENISEQQIEKIIMKRHRVSGYQLNYQPAQDDLKNKKYRNMNENEKQNFLKDEFFKQMNKIAKSNISLALLFWLRSTNEVVGNVIKINSLKELDFSFMSTLSLTKILTLHAIILHEKLNIENLTDILNNSINQSKNVLNILIDDGVLLNDGKYYYINPLLYRQSVNLLKSKNFIH